MRRILLLTVFALAAMLGASGCVGGGTSNQLPEDNPDAGIYTAEYSYDDSSSAIKGVRAVGGNITVALAKDNNVTVTVVDNTSGTLIGTGRLSSQEAFAVTCTGAAGSVVVEGSLKKSALSKSYVGKGRGSIKFTYDAPLAISNVTVSLFAGTYSGSADMRNFDSWPTTAAIDANGFVNVSIAKNGQTVKLKGLVYSDGRVILNPDDDQTQKYWGRGACYMFGDLSNLYMNVPISEKKDGKEVGIIRAMTPYLPE